VDLKSQPPPLQWPHIHIHIRTPDPGPSPLFFPKGRNWLARVQGGKSKRGFMTRRRL
jgi:hypothetical protein